MPLISVIVPVYKVEPYLSRCIDSILEQTFTDFELILINDGSPDNCGKICDEYAKKDSRIHVIHQENSGLSAARNSGIDWSFKNSNSQFISFIDSDDIVSDVYLEKLYNELLDDLVDISTCKMQSFFEKDALISDILTNASPTAPPKTYAAMEAVCCLYKKDDTITVSACGKLYRKHIFNNIRFPINKIHEDQAVTPILLYSSRKITSLSETLYFNFVRSDSIMHSRFSNKRFDDIEAIENCENYFKNKQEDAIAKLACKRKLILWAIYNLQAISEKKHKQIPKKYKLSRRKSIYILEKQLSYDEFTWRLAYFYPKLVKPYSIWVAVLKRLKLYKNTNT